MKLNRNFTLRTVAGENMLVNALGKTSDLSTFFSVNEPVAWLWSQIGDREFDEEMLADLICGEYDVEREVAVADIKDMLKVWRTYGIIKD